VDPTTRQAQRGAAAVEFAILSVLVFTILFGIIQYAMYFWSTQSAADAAREAARRAAVGQTCNDMNAGIQANVKLAQTTPTVTRKYYTATDVSYSTPVATPANGSNVRIVITYNSVDLNFPFLPFISNGAVRETSVARVENYSTAVPANWAVC